jgi:hypothetical protein
VRREFLSRDAPTGYSKRSKLKAASAVRSKLQPRSGRAGWSSELDDGGSDKQYIAARFLVFGASGPGHDAPYLDLTKKFAFDTKSEENAFARAQHSKPPTNSARVVLI